MPVGVIHAAMPFCFSFLSSLESCRCTILVHAFALLRRRIAVNARSSSSFFRTAILQICLGATCA
jgi:hypothetical protein